MEQKLIDLEVRLAFQEQEIHALNTVVVKQQNQIDQLLDAIKVLREKMQEMTPSNMAPQSDEEPPPHY